MNILRNILKIGLFLLSGCVTEFQVLEDKTGVSINPLSFPVTTIIHTKFDIWDMTHNK